MQFKLFALATTAFSAISVVQAALPADTVINNLTALTKLSADGNQIANTINPINVIAAVVGLTANLQTIVRDTEKYTLEFNQQGTEGHPYRDTEQLGICKAFRDYTGTQKALLSTVGGKERLIGIAFITGNPIPIALSEVLLGLERSGRALGKLIVTYVPVCAEGARQDKAILDEALGNAVRTFPIPLPLGV